MGWIINTYDFLIIGGGSAGCVLANRLSADPAISVCLLEAGPRDSNPFIHMPMGVAALQTHNTLNWRYVTTRQIHCNDRQFVWSQGRTLGGCSSINGSVYIRGNAEDYNQWSKLGNTGWTFEEVLPYFKKLEHFDSSLPSDLGHDGPLNIMEHARFVNPLANVFLQAAHECGFNINENFNWHEQEGVGLFQVTHKGGERVSNADAYLHPVEDRKNLTIKTNAHVIKLLIKDKKAIGIRYYQAGHVHDIFARREVIVSAGTIVSPTILLHSGIGPANELRAANIPLTLDLPGVGENLQDHIDIHLTSFEKTTLGISARPKLFLKNIYGLVNYLVNKHGPFTNNISQAGGFLKLDPKHIQPDIQYHFIPCFYPREGKVPYFDSAYTIETALLHPRTRGRITVVSNDPFIRPLIDPNYFADEQDLDDITQGFMRAREIFSQPAFQRHSRGEFEPGANVKTIVEIQNYIRTNSQTASHPVGTCKMGHDDLSVVDDHLRVYGIKNLRVVDASVMPLEISGNTNAAVTMIAEKAADLILSD